MRRPPKAMRKIFIKVILPVLVIIVAMVAARAMISSRKVPKRISPVSQGPVVETMEVELVDLPVTVRGTGTVAARQQVEIIPQVSGLVERIAPGLVQGAFFSHGELLLEIEETDYLLALEQARAELAKAELDLALIDGQAVIARREWRMLGNQEKEPLPLVVYGPQLASAQATLASAAAKVKLAEANLERTKIRAPFNCLIRTKNVDVGQYLRAGTVILDIAGTDAAEIVVPLPLADLPWLVIPRQNQGQQGSPATITMAVGRDNYSWSGFVSRSLGEVDTKTRMVDLVIVINDPYRLAKESRPGRELAVGSFVQVEIVGQVLPQVVRIPRHALHGDNSVWLVTDRGELLQRHVEVARKEKESVLVSKGLAAGERLALTPVRGAANGLVVRERPGSDTP